MDVEDSGGLVRLSAFPSLKRIRRQVFVARRPDRARLPAARNADILRPLVLTAATRLRLGIAMDVIAIQQAYEAAHSGKWDKAIKILRRALWKAKPDERDVLKKQLAQCLSGRAVKKAKSASFTIESVARVRQEIFPLAVDALLSGELTDETQQKYRKLIELAAHGPGSDKAAWRSKIVRYVAVSVVLGAVVVGLSLAIGVGRLWAVVENVFYGLAIVSIVYVVGAQLFSWIGSFFSEMNKLVTPGLRYTERGYRPPCRVCEGEADYEFATESHGTVALCESHAAALRSVLEYSPRLSRSDRALPRVEGLQQNLQAVNSLLSQFKVK
jgi:hypothetical protein